MTWIYFFKDLIGLFFVNTMSIIKHIRAKFIDISAKLKIGKSIGTISKKSSTYPLKTLSIPFPIVPPKRYASPIDFQ